MLLAEGINLGLRKMAEATTTHGFWELMRIARWHVEGDAFDRALTVVVEAQAALPMAAFWGTGRTASSDGQLFLCDARLGHPLVEVGDQVSGPGRPRRFSSSRRGGRCLRCSRQSEPRAQRASRVDWPGPAGCGRHQETAGAARQRPSDVAVAGATAPARRRRLPKAVIGLGCAAAGAVPSLRRTSTASSKGSAAGDASIQRAEHSRRVAAKTAVAPHDVIQRIRHGRARMRGRFGDKVAETLPSGTVRDHRVEGLAGVPRADQRPSQLRECPERLADRGRLVPKLRFARDSAGSRQRLPSAASTHTIPEKADSE